MGDTAVARLPDGRDLAWIELGDPRGRVVFMFHGTPGSRRLLSFDEATISGSGVRLVAPDRPGYGESSYRRGRQLGDWVKDVVYLADYLTVPRFSVVGWSGGGPYALACARFLPERVVAAGVVGGIGPIAVPGREEAMMGLNVMADRLARRSAHLAYPLFAFSSLAMRTWPELGLRIGASQLPEADIKVLARPRVKAALVDDFRCASLTSPMAAAHEFFLFAHDWGFALSEIAVPVHIWHGTADRNVPFSHGKFQAESIPGARLNECRGEGHLLIFDHLEEILRTVAASGESPDGS